MTDTCTLCGLPITNHPVVDPEVTGEFCCRGCLEVSRTICDVEDVSTAEIRERTQSSPSEESATDHAVETAEAFLEVDGMHCTTCESFIALRGEACEGIRSVEASYTTDTARVRYDAETVDPTDLPTLLSGYGYTARIRHGTTTDRTTHDEETLQRLLLGGFLALLIMPWYVFFLYPSYVGLDTGVITVDMTTPVGLYLPMTVVGLLAGVVVFYTGWPILRGAYVSVRTGQPNMHLLLTVAIVSAFAYSTVALVNGSIHLYYDVSVAIVLVVTGGNYYERRLKRQATGLLSSLTSMRVTEATRRCEDGSTETVDVTELEPRDEVVVRPGERVPIDGMVVEGTAAVDEAVLTGESLPKTKRQGDDVVGGSVVSDSALVIAVDADAESTLDRITSLLWAVQSERPAVQRFADRLASVFVPLVLVVGVSITLWRLSTGDSASAALLAGLTVLVAACPCAMGLATPLAIASGLRDALQRGIVVTNSSLFETAPAVDTVVFDKTGTLTTGEMTVQSVTGDPEALEVAAAVERHSSHPVASAIIEYATVVIDGGARGNGQTSHVGSSKSAATVTEFERHPGDGVSARVDGERVVVGTPELVGRRAGSLSEDLQTAVGEARSTGHLPVVVGRGGQAVAVAVVGDRERDDWQAVFETFDDKRIVVLTGDDEAATTRFRDHPAVDQVFAEVPPDGKAATVRELRTTGTTAMIGDGTNDAPALGVADVGIAIAGTAHAADAADVVMVGGTLGDVPAVFDLASATRRRIRENVAWALCYNGIVLPLAAFGVLNPLLAALAMAASSVLVVTNSRRPLLR
ncbi:heavy metal translocating P-type ATPase [Salinigranum rubrum]|uniref:Heavy metal translocating P-type ATPase n=1 Tax=Salinigranum rubrum TaxID=755307 RepID=A0A2I8VKN9_9EURY|nr:heavy metal translocating P-type ATPase [Salinigranum rubrum]AUV82497.1 heavy metal translocating P-type ATPase [Salinigranum rubrum]